jgi:hypothetical protein
MSLFHLILSSLLLLVTAARANALTIDAFLDDGSVSSTSTVGTTKTLYIPSAKAVGGGRSFSATKSGAGTGVSRLEIVDTSLGYTQGAHAGYATVTWDGDSDPTTIKPNGLGALDLIQDGGTAFNRIKTSAERVFRQGIEVCQGSCVTVSYAQDVESLTPQFKILENEASKIAQQVKKCYARLRIPQGAGSGSGRGSTSQTVTNVRAGLNDLIQKCRRTNVCKDH